MSTEHTRSRGNLFEYAQKQKPSQPDFHGDCTIEGTAYEIRGWHREEQMAVSFTLPRGDSNKIPPDAFRGALDRAPPPPKVKGKKGQAAADPTPNPNPVWSGDIVGDEAAYTVRAFEKQGKSGMYFTLTFERIEKPAKDESASQWEDPPDAVDE